MSRLNFKYVRIQGKELARNTMYAKGVFSMCMQMIRDEIMDTEALAGGLLERLERYNHPYFLVYTNTPGEIVYEDKYQICAKTDGFLQIDEVQPSWSPTDEGSDA